MQEKTWQPTATVENLRLRAQLIQKIRNFFQARNILEVETPQLAQYGVTDPYMPLIQADNPLDKSHDQWFLQSSPEYAMKRLLSADSGSIFQICKAYRHGEVSRRHNPEFSMLEWYRIGFDDQQLMQEINDLLKELFNVDCIQKTYGEVFQDYLNINPYHASINELINCCKQHLDFQMSSDNRDDWLNLLIAEVIEPQLPKETPCFITNYPASQAALAKIAYCKNFNTPVAKRFELFWQGIELANGYHELTDYHELKQRLEQEEKTRTHLGHNKSKTDTYLIAAQQHGLPECAGVALGLDRLIMIACNAKSINEVISFSSDRS